MEEFFLAIEKHKETALYVGMFIWICCATLRKDYK